MQTQLEVATLYALHPTAARTATGQGSSVDVRDVEGDLAIVLDSAAGTGTTPTLDAKLQDSDDGSTGWADVSGATFTQVVGAAAQQKIVVDANAAKRYVRVAYTIGGTTPSFTFSVNALGRKKTV